MAMEGMPDMTSATKRTVAASFPRRSTSQSATANPTGIATTAAKPTMISVPMIAL